MLVERETLAWLIALGRKIEAAQVLNPGFIGKEALRVMPRFLGGGGVAYFFPPPGGVPAASYNTTTDTLSAGSAVCARADRLASGAYEEGTTTETVENITSFVVGASGRPMACALTDYGRWVVIVEDCGSSSTGGGGPTPNPDVGDSGSSRGIDMGYSLGV